MFSVASLGGQEEHGRLESLLAQPASDLNPLDVGEHPVEDDEIRLESRDGVERVAPVVRLLDLVALVAESGGDGVDDRLLVVDDEDALLHAVASVEAHVPTVPRLSVNCLRIASSHEPL